MTIFVISFLFASALVILTGVVIYRMTPRELQHQALIAELPWFAKGFLVPFALWLLMNIGISFNLQPFMPSIQRAQNSGLPWFPFFMVVAAAGLFVIATWWTAVTMIWIVTSTWRKVTEETRTDFRALCFTSILITALPALLFVYLGGRAAYGMVAVMIFAPIAYHAPGIVTKPKRTPMYSRAIARMKFGKYSEAEKEILSQLEHSENDFNGWLMLAELHATRFNELDDAEKIILDICVQPKITPVQTSIALQKLADWQLNLAGDPAAAARTLQIISERLPGTHLAHMANLRRAQLPNTASELREQREPHAIPLPALSNEPLWKTLPTQADQNKQHAVERINQLTASLIRDPNSISDREQLARLFADPLGKVDLAIEQIELLLGTDRQPAVKRVEWLSLISNWQSTLKNDHAAAIVTLERIVREFPSMPQAFAAQRRLNLLKAEAAARKV